jgi:lipoyl(octanoyl) transferase
VEPEKLGWRFLVTEPSDGATNMAIDEAMWRGRQAGTSPATLRFFAWAPPTVSLGYGQPLDRHVDAEACRRRGVGIVRRPTGGSAIYHDGPERELTYSVAATAEDLGVSADLLDTYRWIGRALVRGLRALGAAANMVPTGRGLGRDPAFCFARTAAYEIEIGGKKVVGSAQRRQGTSFLQQGAVLLGVDEARLRALFPTTPAPLDSLTTLEAAIGTRPTFEEVAAVLRDAFEAEHGLSLTPGGLTDDESARVDRLVHDRYGRDAFLTAPVSSAAGHKYPAAGHK